MKNENAGPARRSWGMPVAILGLSIAADQLSKNLIVETVPHGGAIPIIPGFFDLTLTYNIGAAFGLFAGLPDSVRGIVLLATTVIAFAIVAFYMRSSHGHSSAARAGFGLIVGGAIGNLIDRLRLGAVV